MKIPSLITKLLPLAIVFSVANVGQLYAYQERVVICMVPIEYADAEQLANVLAPFLSSEGQITAYSPTNTLIIKDQPSVVRMLVKTIKGKEDLSECTNLKDGREGSNEIP